jgi:hypothetical protein
MKKVTLEEASTSIRRRKSGKSSSKKTFTNIFIVTSKFKRTMRFNAIQNFCGLHNLIVDYLVHYHFKLLIKNCLNYDYAIHIG